MKCNIVTKAQPGDHVMVANYRRKGFVEAGCVTGVVASWSPPSTGILHLHFSLSYSIVLDRTLPETRRRPWRKALRLTVDEAAIKNILKDSP